MLQGKIGMEQTLTKLEYLKYNQQMELTMKTETTRYPGEDIIEE